MVTINTIQDLLNLLDENPEWVDALRARLLTQELLELPEHFSQFAVTTNSRLDKLEITLQQFIEATNKRFDALEARQSRLEATLDQFIESTNQFIESTNQFIETANKRFDALEAGQARLEAGQDRHESEIKALRRDIGVLRGGHARTTAIRKSAGIARGMGLRRSRNLSMDDLYDMTDSADTSGIHANVLTSFANADLVMEATDSEGETCYIAAEISYTVQYRDISRATRNSRFLTRFTGSPAFPAVSGEIIDDDVQDVIDSGEVFWYHLSLEDLEVE